MQKEINTATSDASSDVTTSEGVANALESLLFPVSTPTEEPAVADASTAETTPEDNEGDDNLDNDVNDDVDVNAESEEASPEADDDDSNVDPDDDEDDKEKSKLSPEQQKVYDKNLGKVRAKYRAERDKVSSLTAEKDSLTSELSDVKAQLAEAEAAKSIPVNLDSSNPLFSIVKNEAELDTFIQRQFDLRADVLNNESEEGDSFLIGADGQNIPLDAKGIKNVLATIDRNIHQHARSLRRYFADDAKANLALENIPDVLQKNSELSLALNSTLVKNPSLKLAPGYKVKAYYMALGEMLAKNHGKDAWNLAKSTKQNISPAKAKSVPIPPKVAKKEPAVSIAATPKVERIKGSITQSQVADHLAKVLFT